MSGIYFLFIPCQIDKLLHYEKRLINYFKPEMNGVTGGKRKGAGRKVGSYVNSKPKPTKVMRVPEPLVEHVEELIKNYYESL